MQFSLNISFFAFEFILWMLFLHVRIGIKISINYLNCLKQLFVAMHSHFDRYLAAKAATAVEIRYN